MIVTSLGNLSNHAVGHLPLLTGFHNAVLMERINAVAAPAFTALGGLAFVCMDVPFSVVELGVLLLLLTITVIAMSSLSLGQGRRHFYRPYFPTLFPIYRAPEQPRRWWFPTTPFSYPSSSQGFSGRVPVGQRRYWWGNEDDPDGRVPVGRRR